ncbi:MAG: heme-copper oxidase subunit III [Actinomycetota bacterium]
MTYAHATNETAGRPSLTTVGMIIFLGSEVMFFGGMFAAYFTLRAQTPGWPGEGVHLDTVLGLVFTGVLVLSSLTSHQAARAGAAGDVNRLVRWTVITMVLGAAFVGNQAFEWSSLDFTIASHPFGSLFYLMTGFHGLHLLGGLAAMALLVTFVRRSARVHHGAVEAISMYWHFVDVVWVLLFITIFYIR